MWLKINDRLYNADHLAEIFQEEVIYVGDTDRKPEVKTFAITGSGEKIVLSDEPVLNRLVWALNSKEVW